MSDFFVSGEVQITHEALRQVADLNDLFRTTVRARACEIAAEAGSPPLVTAAVLEQAALMTCGEIAAHIRSQSGRGGTHDGRGEAA